MRALDGIGRVYRRLLERGGLHRNVLGEQEFQRCIAHASAAGIQAARGERFTGEVAGAERRPNGQRWDVAPAARRAEPPGARAADGWCAPPNRAPRASAGQWRRTPDRAGGDAAYMLIQFVE